MRDILFIFTFIFVFIVQQQKGTQSFYAIHRTRHFFFFSSSIILSFSPSSNFSFLFFFASREIPIKTKHKSSKDKQFNNGLKRHVTFFFFSSLYVLFVTAFSLSFFFPFPEWLYTVLRSF